MNNLNYVKEYFKNKEKYENSNWDNVEKISLKSILIDEMGRDPENEVVFTNEKEGTKEVCSLYFNFDNKDDFNCCLTKVIYSHLDIDIEEEKNLFLTQLSYGLKFPHSLYDIEWTGKPYPVDGDKIFYKLGDMFVLHEDGDFVKISTNPCAGTTTTIESDHRVTLAIPCKFTIERNNDEEE